MGKQVIKEGFLDMRRSSDGSILNIFRKPWKRYWFVLYSSKLEYYHVKNSNGPDGFMTDGKKPGKLSGSFKLVSFSSRPYGEEESTRPFDFEVFTPDCSIVLSAESKEELHAWIKSLKATSRKQRAVRKLLTKKVSDYRISSQEASIHNSAVSSIVECDISNISLSGMLGMQQNGAIVPLCESQGVDSENHVRFKEVHFIE